MSFFGAMTTAVNSIRAQASALGHISDNIANSQTTGFKRTDTSFFDVVTVSGSRAHLPGSVTARPAYTNAVQGVINTSAVKTHMAINGEGFFVVSQRLTTVDNEPVFMETDRFTRRGDFTVDGNGYLVNGGGYFLKGIAMDPNTGNRVGNVLTRIQIEQDMIQARETTQIQLEANLPSLPGTTNHDPATADSELLLPGDFNNNPTALVVASATDGFVQAQQENLFLDRSLSGGAITAYDNLGNPHNVQLRWAKVDNVADGGGSGGGDTWNLFYKTNDAATGADPKWQNVGTNYIFNDAGQLNPAIASVTVTGMTINGTGLGDKVLNHGTGNITQFADVNRKVKVNAISQDGFAAGSLVEIAVSGTGKLTGSYSNGKTVDLADIALVKFNAPDKLEKVDGTAFIATEESGVARQGASGGVVGNASEASNVDIADQFSKLIVTQQAYTAGTRIVTTADEMIRETLNMKR